MSGRVYGAVERLAESHDLEGFDCGVASETEWLIRHARHAQAARTSVTWVVCRDGETAVKGYYALAASSLESSRATERARQGAGRYPIPVTLLTRLGVDVGEQGQGLGRALLKDAFQRTAAQAEQVASRALVVHAEDNNAKAFYVHHAEFEELPGNPLHLVLLMKDLERAMGELY